MNRLPADGAIGAPRRLKWNVQWRFSVVPVPFGAALCVLLCAAACAGDGSAGDATAVPAVGDGSDPAQILRAPRPADAGPTGEPAPGSPPAAGSKSPRAPERAGRSDAGSPRPERPAGAAGGGEGCHPAYDPCLADLPGDALDCADLAEELKPVVVWDEANDPYDLGERRGWLACTGEKSDQDVAAAPVAPQPVAPAPPTEPTLPPAPPAGGAPVEAPAPLPDDPGEPAPTEPEPTEPPAGSTQGPTPTTQPPPTEQPEPPPPDPLVPPDEENTAEYCNPDAAPGEEQWCLPELTVDGDGDEGVIRLFWCDGDPHASPDLEVYVDSDTALKYRTRALTLSVGTRLERYATCRGFNAVEVVTAIGRVEVPDSDVPRMGITMCGRFYFGAELYSWGEGVYTAWQDADGRFRVDMPDPVEYLGPC